MTRQKHDHQPFEFLPTAIYPQSFLVATLGLAKNTIIKWHRRGLKILPTETRVVWYLGADIIRFLEQLSREDAA